MPYFDKHFTVEEANNLLPEMQDIFRQIHELIGKIQVQSKILSLKPERLTLGKTNGDHRKDSMSPNEVKKKINDLLTQITDQGIVIQDVQRGLIDFPAFIDGDEVFLCYELSDGDHIHYYHHLDAGYAGRTPLSEE